MTQEKELDEPNDNYQFPHHNNQSLHLKNCIVYSTYALSTTRYKYYKAAVPKTAYASINK